MFSIALSKGNHLIHDQLIDCLTHLTSHDLTDPIRISLAIVNSKSDLFLQVHKGLSELTILNHICHRLTLRGLTLAFGRSGLKLSSLFLHLEISFHLPFSSFIKITLRGL